MRKLKLLEVRLGVAVGIEWRKKESYNAPLQEVQQQFLCYKEKSNKRFQEFEE